jgi:glutaconate CoA-transferase subunit B
VESGQLEIEQYTHFGMNARLFAGASGLPFFPIKSNLGTDLPKFNPKIKTIHCPYTGEELTTVPALNPDVAIVAVQRCDTEGNAHLWGVIGDQREAAFASRKVILVVEEVVDDAVIRSDPNRTIIPGLKVDAVVEEPWGTHPSFLQGYYDRDDAFFFEWDKICRDDETLKAYMDEWIYGVAKRTHAPGVTMIYESGIIGANPGRMPITIVDPTLVTGASSICSMMDVFCLYLQGGLIDVGFISGAQIDRFGNINATVIGPYRNPKVRLPGSGGSCEIATHSKRLLMMLPHVVRRFPEKVDFITSPGFLGGREEREALGLPGGGPEAVITDLGVMEFDKSGEMFLALIYPGVSVGQFRENTGWPLKIASDLQVTPEPTEEELRVLRSLDPTGHHLRHRE